MNEFKEGDFIRYDVHYYRIHKITTKRIPWLKTDFKEFHLQKCNLEFVGKVIHAKEPDKSKEFYFRDKFKLVPEKKISEKLEGSEMIIWTKRASEYIEKSEKVIVPKNSYAM